MTIGEHVLAIRKQKSLSQGELGKRIGTSGDIFDRYEGSLITPSIDVIMKIADELEVAIDFLGGKINLILDKITLLRDHKTQRTYS